MVSFLLTCATPSLSLIAGCGLMGATPQGQPWTPALTLPHVRDGLSVRRMAVLWTFRRPSMEKRIGGRIWPQEELRSAWVVSASCGTAGLSVIGTGFLLGASPPGHL